MADRKYKPGGVPDLSVEEIEAELQAARFTPTLTERWMSARARREMDKLGEHGRELKRAYELGYRRGAEVPFLGTLIFLGAILLLAFLTR